MKVLHVSAYAFRGGCESDCYHLINGSKEHQHQIIVLGPEGPMSDSWMGAQTPIKHLNCINFNWFKFISVLKQSVADKHFDCIIYWSNIKFTCVLEALKNASENILVHLGNPFPYRSMSFLNERLLSLFLSHSPNVVLIGCSKYVTSSFQDKAYFGNFKNVTVYNPVRIPPFEAKTTIVHNAVFKMGMVARLDPIKNHQLLIDAFEIVHKQVKEAELHIVGNGILMKALKQKVSRLSCRENIHFHGECKNVYDILNTWDLFVYSTTDQEGLGNAVIEALANGLPMVLPDLPMMREIGQEMEGIWWYKSTDASQMAERILEAKRSINENKDFIPRVHLSMHNSAMERFSPPLIAREYLSYAIPAQK